MSQQHPNTPGGFPAAKRPKLSTDSLLPTTPSSLSFPSPHLQTPSSISGSPMSGNTSNSMLPPPVPGPGGSGPAKLTDTTELADALASAGIDLREEEARLSDLTPGSFDPTQQPPHGAPPGMYPGMQPIMHVGPNGQFLFTPEQKARAEAQIRANHQNNPFLNLRMAQFRVVNLARDNKLQGTTYSHQNSMDIATLISLATRERLIGLLNRASAISRQRRRANGMIDGEWAPLVKGGTKNITKADSTTPTTEGRGVKREREEENVVTTLHNETAKALRQIAQKEYEAEQARKEARAAKAAGASTTGGGEAPSTPGGSGAGIGSAPGTPGAEGFPGEGGRKMSREARKQVNSKIEEAASHRAANATSAMMINGFGLGKRKKYSWMTGGPGGAGGAGKGAAAQAAPETPGTTGGNQPGVVGGTVVNAWGKRWGEWKDEKIGAVNVKDWIGALEDDNRDNQAIVKAYLKLK